MRNTVIAIGKEIIKNFESDYGLDAYDILYKYEDKLEYDEFNMLYTAILNWYDFMNGSISTNDMIDVKTSYAPGYMSRKDGALEKLYIGKYGVGIAVHKPAFNTSKYHLITYYLF